MTKSEEIARAIANAGGEDPDRIVGGRPLWVFHVSQARAAMEAMKRVTWLMREAGDSVDDEFMDDINCGPDVIKIFNKMLDAALAESP